MGNVHSQGWGRVDSRVETCSPRRENYEISQVLLNRGCPNLQPGLEDVINTSAKGMH